MYRVAFINLIVYRKMNKSDDPWSRCAKEFTTSDDANKELKLPGEIDDSITRPVHVQRIDFNNGFSSCNRGLVATDVALAGLEKIERNELVTKWIEDGICTPPFSEQNTSYPSSPVFLNLSKNVERVEEEKSPSATHDLEKSPIIKCRSKVKTVSKRRESLQGLEKSPKIGKRRRSSRDTGGKFGLRENGKLDNTRSSNPSDKSPILGKGANSSRKYRHRIKRKRLQDQTGLGTESFLSSVSENQTESGFKTEELGAEGVSRVKEEIDISQDIFDEEISTARENEGDLFCSYEEVNVPLKSDDDETKAELIVPEPLWEHDVYRSSPAIKAERSSPHMVKVEEDSFGSVIQDTEEFFPPKAPERRFIDYNRSEQEGPFPILDSEFFSIEKRKFVTDTERIDYETSSENEEAIPDLKHEKISTGGESDSDKTASDIIEEPTTQDYFEPLKPAAIITQQSAPGPSSPKKSISAASSKISEIISPKDPISSQISVANISVETTPPRTPESTAHAVDLLDSGKKKKSKPKKGSLGARLQKLISGQVSCVRLWRHQMSRESAIERSSAPCATLLVVEAWMECGKNMHQSKVVDDPYDLLKDCLGTRGKEKERKLNRNLVVMTNPDFVGSVKLPSGTVFRTYLPWQVFNRNSDRGSLVLDVLYFQVVSSPGKLQLEGNVDECEAVRHSNEIMEREVTREYHCPCLVDGKIDDSCPTKFTNRKIDVIDEIIK